MSPPVQPPFATQEELLQGSVRAHRLVYGLVGNTAIADDIIQEAWLRALERPPRKTGSISGWWSRVVRNLVIDWFRRERPVSTFCEQTVGDAVPQQVDPANEATRAEASYVLLGAVKDLTEPYRTAVTLHYLDGLPVSEVGQRMKVPASTVRTQLMRARQRLESTLESRMGGTWKAMLLGAFPVQHLLPAAAEAGKLAATSESARTSATLKAKASQGALAGKSGASTAAVWSMGILATSTLAWVIFSGQSPWSPGPEVQEAQLSSPMQLAGVDHSQIRTEATASKGEDLTSPQQKLLIKDPAGLITFPIKINAYRVQQQMSDAALDAPSDAFMVLEERQLQFTSLELELPGGANGQTWVYDVQAGGVATERIISTSNQEQTLVWEPRQGRDFAIQVLDPGGFAIQGAGVFAGARVPTSGNFPVQWQTSDSSGWVRFANMPAAQLRIIASHKNAGFIDLSEAQAIELGEPQDHAIIPLRLGVGMAADLDIQQTLSAAFPFGISMAGAVDFLSLISAYYLNPNRLQLENLSRQPKNLEGLFVASGLVKNMDGGVAKNALVILELDDFSSAWTKTDALGKLQVHSRQAIRKLAVLDVDGYARIDDTEKFEQDPTHQDFGELTLAHYTTADVILPANPQLGTPQAGLLKASEEVVRPFGPTQILAPWSAALMQASHWLEVQRLDSNRIRFRAPGADLLGKAWVQFPGYSQHSVKLKPGGTTTLHWEPWQNLNVHFTGLIGEPGDRFELSSTTVSSMFAGKRLERNALPYASLLEADGQSLVFKDLRPGPYSLFSQGKNNGRICLASFEVLPGVEQITLTPPEMGFLAVEIPDSWKGAGWLRISPVLNAGEKPTGMFPRMPLGWEHQTQLEIPVGHYSVVAHRIGSVPAHHLIQVKSGQVTELSLNSNEFAHRFRLDSPGERQIRRVMLVLDGFERKKSWLFRRASLGQLPSGGVLANRSFSDKEALVALILEVDGDGRFEFRGDPKKDFQIFGLDQDRIWSHKVSLSLGEMAAEKEIVLQMKWPYSLVLQHADGWQGWTGVRVVSAAIRDQPLDMLTNKTELTLKSTGDVQLTFEFTAPGGIREEQSIWVSVLPEQTGVVFVQVPVPPKPVAEAASASKFRRSASENG